MKNPQKISNIKRGRRVRRVRARVIGTNNRPRLSVFRSSKSMSAQLIDDTLGRTLIAVHERELETTGGTKTERAIRVGTLLATRAKEKGLTRIVFDRRHYRYHGRVAAFAKAARAAGLQF